MNRLLRPIAFLLILACTLPLLIACGKDKKENEPTFRTLTWAVGAPLPTPADFAVTLPEGASLRFAEDYAFTRLGAYELTVILTPKKGKESRHSVRVTFVKDTEPPVMMGVGDISAYVGDGIAYRTGVEVLDNCDGETTLEVDTSAVIADAEGEYPVTYIAKDAAGNTATQTVTLYLYRERVTEEMLYALLDPIIDRYIPTAGTRLQQAREVYNYVYGTVAYTAHSDKSDWVRAAYEGLTTEQGDCFTYFALSKAFFIRLGIDNMDIKRTEGIVEERHYWNYINVGTAASPRWYHFDACRVRDVQYAQGCILTDLQVAAFSRQRVDAQGMSNYYYAYDRAAYPASAEEIVSETPWLEAYY